MRREREKVRTPRAAAEFTTKLCVLWGDTGRTGGFAFRSFLVELCGPTDRI